jgi:C4-dicarboxylate transporter, DctM subunit
VYSAYFTGFNEFTFIHGGGIEKMNPEVIGIIGICIMLILMFLQMPLAVAMALVGFIGFCYLSGSITEGSYMLSAIPYRTASTYMLTVIPLFILMGMFAAHSGLSGDAFYAINKWLGHFPGGLAMATIGGCAGFAAVCGAATATAATMCAVALPEMRRYKYSDQLSLGTISCGGMLGFMIPPSIPFIIYAYLTEESVGSLFIAGILPGLLITILFIIAIYITCRLNPSLGAAGPRATWRERFTSIHRIWGVLILFLLVLGGMYSGVFTPTEGGAVGAFGALIIGLSKRRISWKLFFSSLIDTGRIAGMIFLLIIGSTILNSFITITDIPFALANFVEGIAIDPITVVLILMIILIIFGFFMDIMALMIILIPIIYPLLVNMGIDPVWFGVLVVLNIMIGNITPPVGIVVYTVAGLVKDVPLFTIFRGVWPFFFAMCVALFLLIAFPQISLILPHMMKPG